jgi:hypothetical protein
MKHKCINRFENTQLFAFFIIGVVFVIIDSIQLFLYPFIFIGKLESVRQVIIAQLPRNVKDLDLHIVFYLLIINVVLRVFALLALTKWKRISVYCGLISNVYTIMIVVFILTANIIWETIAMILLSILLIWGYAKQNGLKNEK